MNASKNNLVILMTATIEPNSFTTLALKDPDVRREQYIDALKFYLAKTNLNIVFTENSGCSIEKQFEDYKDKNRIEFLIYKSEPTIPDKGKGAKELEIINYAVNNSKFISDCDAIVKVTGRLKVLNIVQLYLSFLNQKNMHRKIFSSNIYKISKMDARCFFFTIDFWSYFHVIGQSIDLKYSIEMAMWDSIFLYQINGGLYKQLESPLRIQGVNAGFGTSYEDSFITATAKRIRHYVRAPYYYQEIRKRTLGEGENYN